MKKNIRKYALTGTLLLSLIGGTYYYVLHRQEKDLEGIAYGNGRIEAQSIDIATRHGGRVISVPVEEGQMVAAGDIVAELNLQDLAASLAGAEANVRASIQQKEAAASSVTQAESSLELAGKEFTRADKLSHVGAVSASNRDQSLNTKQLAAAQLAAAQKNLSSAAESIEVSQAEVARLKDLLTDQYLHAPKAGRVLYKLVEPGEVMAAGGKAVTLLDLTDVYMTIFLPTNIVGQLKLGDEARIIVDALPDIAIPAYISYISPEAQFTPRQVETRTEREKLTFRVKIKIPPELLAKHIESVKTGLPGMAYIRLDKNKDWPDKLKGDEALLKEVKARP